MKERTIRVTGKGKISVKPDTIRININASKVFKEYEQAVEGSAEETGLLREAIARAGLDPKSLKTTHFGIDTEYESYRDKKDRYRSRFVGYRYNHSLYFQFENDNKLLGRVLYELAHCSVDVKFSLMHTVKDEEAVKNELLAKAVEDSRAKAEALTRAAGVSLGEIQLIDYSWGELQIYSEPMRYMDMECAKIGCAGSIDIDIEADDIDVQDTVTVVWEIA